MGAIENDHRNARSIRRGSIMKQHKYAIYRHYATHDLDSYVAIYPDDTEYQAYIGTLEWGLFVTRDEAAKVLWRAHRNGSHIERS